jgi:hypothetical protein
MMEPIGCGRDDTMSERSKAMPDNAPPATGTVGSLALPYAKPVLRSLGAWNIFTRGDSVNKDNDVVGNDSAFFEFNVFGD